MKLFKKIVHSNIQDLNGKAFNRRTARGIILDGSNILLMFTKSYNDYSFPGGGVNHDEDLKTALKRELQEEIGASEIEVIDEYGLIDEYRPSNQPEYDLIHMKSYFFVCKVGTLGTPKLEDYEIAHGMNAVWVDLHEAILHNRTVIDQKEESMGFSIKRETFVLEHIAKYLL